MTAIAVEAATMTAVVAIVRAVSASSSDDSGDDSDDNTESVNEATFQKDEGIPENGSTQTKPQLFYVICD